MGGLGPGIGGGEYLVIAVVALLVVGPERLPLLLRKLGKMVAKARGMANEFRSSFDEMARQSELDELRKEVEALRTGQGMHALGADADAAFREIRDDLNKPLNPPMLAAPDEWPDSPPVMAPLEAPVADVTPPKPKPKTARKTPAKAKPAASIKAASGKATPVRARKVDL
jgi:sec-independent protein translocase protein TatB